jgi:TolB protein
MARGQAEKPATLAWYDRTGEPTPTTLEPAPFLELRVSPDGTRAVAGLPGANGDSELWLADLGRGVRTRLVGGSSWNYADAVWSGDGKRVAYTSQERGAQDIYIRNADGSGQVTPVLVDGIDKEVQDWSADGRYVLYRTLGTGSDEPDLRILDTEEGTTTELVAGARAYFGARFSPNAAYVVYVSTENEAFEVFAQARVGGARWQVSTSGGRRPHWSRDAKEIVYFDLDENVVAVPVQRGPDGLKLGKPTTLFRVDRSIAAADTTGDHDRFLVATFDDQEDEPLYVILDWQAGM